MASVKNTDINLSPTQVQVVDRVAEASGATKIVAAPSDQPSILQYDDAFGSLIGAAPAHSLLLSSAETSNNPFWHEACVFIPAYDELYTTSNLLKASKSSNYPTILISRMKLYRTGRLNGKSDIHAVDWVKMRPPTGIDMPNGGVNYIDDSIIFCAQGSPSAGTGGIYHMPRGAPPKALITNFQGRDFNSPNDVVVAEDGSIWFTDPCYGHEQDFRQRPQLPNQIYRYDPSSGDCRVMADGFDRPNGICFSPDERIVYVTDTGYIHGDGSKDLMRPATIYAFDVAVYSGAPFLVNRRVFAYAGNGFPDGIKCDVHGNIYSGCSDGVEVWKPTGSLLGKILVPGGVANFCFGSDGEMFICAETRLWRVQLAGCTKGALLGL
ncbi:MAG: hypothetical protein M1818_007606 [Claussenomyces sp. TS43310]|nr:MAG: hypothetical protein M1818_007606 [Claussenomyces sp. TS43310]